MRSCARTMRRFRSSPARGTIAARWRGQRRQAGRGLGVEAVRPSARLSALVAETRVDEVRVQSSEIATSAVRSIVRPVRPVQRESGGSSIAAAGSRPPDGERRGRNDDLAATGSRRPRCTRTAEDGVYDLDDEPSMSVKSKSLRTSKRLRSAACGMNTSASSSGTGINTLSRSTMVAVGYGPPPDSGATT